MTSYPLKTTRRWSNVLDLEHSPTEEIRTLKLRRPQVAPKGDLGEVNPVTRPEPGLISRQTPVGTIGSCFSSRIQDWLEDYGYNFVRTERDPDTPESWACQTARFGVVFNTGCCRQVFEAAVGRFRPSERWWSLQSGRVQDPYRHGVTWASVEDAEADLRHHASCVRDAVRRCEVFIVTPGLAEVWKSRKDGSTFAAAPPREIFDPETHAFELTSTEENLANLEGMYAVMRELNPAIRVIIAMSPVPLTATFRPMHWAVGNTVSKATLRVAIDQFCAAHPEVVYFPSYELVTALTREPFEIDNIHVKTSLVERIMLTFMSAYGDLASDDSDAGAHGSVEEKPWAWEASERAAGASRLAIDPVLSMRIAYLRETWRRLGLQYADRPVAIVGGGRHTELLAMAVAGIDGPSASCVVDDTPRAPTIGEWPVHQMNQTDPGAFAAVIVSSDAARTRLETRARAWVGEGSAQIEVLYDGIPAGAYPTADLVRWATPEPVVAPVEDWRSRIDSIPGWLRDEEGVLLFESAKGLSELGRVVEVGSFLGRSTVCLACGLESAGRPAPETVLAIDPHVHAPTAHADYEPALGRTAEGDAANPRGVFEANLGRAGILHRVEILQAYSVEAPVQISEGCGLVFIDGDHRYEVAAADLAGFGDLLHPEGRILMHDYTDWEGVTRAVDEAVARGEWTIERVVGSIAVLRPRC